MYFYITSIWATSLYIPIFAFPKPKSKFQFHREAYFDSDSKNKPSYPAVHRIYQGSTTLLHPYLPHDHCRLRKINCLLWATREEKEYPLPPHFTFSFRFREILKSLPGSFPSWLFCFTPAPTSTTCSTWRGPHQDS